MPASSESAIDGVRAGDIRTFLVVQRTGSVKAAARELAVAASYVSKTVARLEALLGRSLFARGARGVTLTEDGQRLRPIFEDILVRFERLDQPRGSGSVEVTVAAESYLLEALLPAFVGCHRGLRVRGIEMPPSLVRAQAAEGAFNLALLTGEGALPELWHQETLGHVRSALFAPPRLAAQLGAPPVAQDLLRTFPFVFPVFRIGQAFLPMDDGCPLPPHERTLGHQAPMMRLAMELAVRSDQLLFGPVIAARSYTARGALVEIPVCGWDIRKRLVVAYDTVRLLSGVRASVVRVLTAEVASLFDA